ncbi:MAG: hypothetical protein AAGA96_20105, partial [Verrucomicrobiota bacterium]
MNETSAEGLGAVVGGLLGCFLAVLVPALFVFFLVMAIVRKSKGWTVAAVLTGVFGLALGAMVIFLGNKAVQKVKETTEIPRVFASEDGLVSVTTPGYWRVLDLASAAAELQLGDPVSEEYLLVISELKTDFEPDFTVEDFASL